MSDWETQSLFTLSCTGEAAEEGFWDVLSLLGNKEELLILPC
jgi:hypothetical protein